MLDLWRYLLGVAEILLLGGFATLGAAALRARLLPSFRGAPAHLATAVLALALLIWVAELLGTAGLFEPVPYVIAVAVAGLGIKLAVGGEPSKAEGPPKPPHLTTFVALAIAAAATIKFGIDVKPKLTTGMTGFDSTWYHGPFAAGFFQTGNTWDLHFIAPQFLAWFYPANAEIFHGIGMLAFERDLLSPLLNLGWFIGCLLACWCIGRPYGVAPWSLALGAVALSLPMLADQAGEARNDIVGVFFLLAAVAVVVNAWAVRDEERGLLTGALIVAGLAAGLAAGAKLNFLLPAAVLVLGLAALAPAGRRWRSFGIATLAALAGGGYWYLRNLAHSGNPLPWYTDVGPVTLPGPDQELGGREGHSVLSYLFDGAVWTDWFLPGLGDGLTALWPILLAPALAGLLLSLGRKSSPALRLTGLVGLAALAAWLIAPTSASGPDGTPRGFESGLRYLAPAIVLGLAALAPALLPRMARRSPAADPPSGGLSGESAGRPPNGRILKVPRSLARHLSGRGVPRTLAVGAAIVIAIAIGYPIQRHYLANRYASPTFAAPGLNAAFAWSRDVAAARIATTGTRQYPLFGADLSNRVQFLGEDRPHGGFVAPTTCRRYRRLLNQGGYDYVVATRDRIEPNRPPYPASAGWTESPGVRVVFRQPPTVVFRLSGVLDATRCR